MIVYPPPNDPILIAELLLNPVPEAGSHLALLGDLLYHLLLIELLPTQR